MLTNIAAVFRQVLPLEVKYCTGGVGSATLAGKSMQGRAGRKTGRHSDDESDLCCQVTVVAGARAREIGMAQR
jgi:hypothetical protein